MDGRWRLSAIRVPRGRGASPMLPRMSTVPAAIEVRNLRKYFQVSVAGDRSLLSRFIHPVSRGRPRVLRVLDGVTFDVGQGELVTIVGRNGAGKSTLLRILGNIYRADGGRVRVHGSLGPFLELGVGFRPEMTARQNVVLNGVMLGLSRREVRHRIDDVLTYAELEEFRDVQIKNFSAGMRARLAFASMLQANPDIYLIDEILAAGDEAFRQKCAGEFAALKARGKTVVLVTHRPGTMEREADRAMLLKDGRIAAQGDTDEVLDHYRADRGGGDDEADAESLSRAVRGDERSPRTQRATIEALAIRGAAENSGRPQVPAGEPLRIRIEAEASGRVQLPTLELVIATGDGTRVSVGRDSDADRLPVLKRGERLTAEVSVENRLAPGSYLLECSLLHHAGDRVAAISPVRSLEFTVEGDSGDGLLAMERTVSLTSGAPLELAR